jgi:hypothetical protein
MKQIRWEPTTVPEQFRDVVKAAWYLKDENNVHYGMVWQPIGTHRCASVHRLKGVQIPINMKHDTFEAATDYLKRELSEKQVLPMAGPDTKWGSLQ